MNCLGPVQASPTPRLRPGPSRRLAHAQRAANGRADCGVRKRIHRRVRQTGRTLASLKFKGVELIHSPLRPDFWRAQTDKMRAHMAGSQAFGAPRTGRAGAEHRRGGAGRGARGRCENSLALPKWTRPGDDCYAVHGNGDVVVEARLNLANTKLPKLVRSGCR